MPSPAARHRYQRRTALRRARRALLSPESTPEQRDEARALLLQVLEGRNWRHRQYAAKALLASGPDGEATYRRVLSDEKRAGTTSAPETGAPVTLDA